MARNENPPFPLGATFFGGDTTVINATDGFQLEGVEYEFEDLLLGTGTIGANAMRSNKRKRMRVVRNVNATTLQPSTMAKLNLGGAAAGNEQGQVNGLCASPADKGYPVDEFLSQGCLQNDLCWVCVEGMASVLTSTAGTTNISIGGVVVNGASGGLVAQDTTQTGANLYNQIQNAVGRAALAVNAVSTAFPVLIGVPTA